MSEATEIALHEQRASIELANYLGVTPNYLVNTLQQTVMPENITKGEMVSCIIVANEYKLNPITGEIFFMRTKRGKIQPIVSVDGWVSLCNRHPQFDGMEFEFSMTNDNEPLSATCIIWRNDRQHPIKATEFFQECARGGGPVWKTHPMRMIRHRALAQAARYAFGYSGIMDHDEFEQWQRMEKAPARIKRQESDIELTPLPSIDMGNEVPPKDIYDELSDDAEALSDMVDSTAAPESKEDKTLIDDILVALDGIKDISEMLEVTSRFIDRVNVASQEQRKEIAAIYKKCGEDLEKTFETEEAAA